MKTKEDSIFMSCLKNRPRGQNHNARITKNCFQNVPEVKNIISLMVLMIITYSYH